MRGIILLQIYFNNVKILLIQSLWKPPKHTVISNSTISKQSSMKNSQENIFHYSIHNNCGDADATSSYNNNHVDPVLKV